MSPLRLFGVVAVDAHAEGEVTSTGARLVTFRDLGAVVGETDGAPADQTQALEAHRMVVEAVFARMAVLPAPAGVVFRGADVLVRWLELHYVTLSDALGFVEGRVGARVHVTRDETAGDAVGAPPVETTEAASDVAAIAAGSFRVLRRHAVASVPLRATGDVGLTASAAFLVERDRWQPFVEAVREEDRRVDDVAYSVTGPWPPYDFVRMQFGG